MKFTFSKATDALNRIQPGAKASNIFLIAILITFVGYVINEAGLYFSMLFTMVVVSPAVDPDPAFFENFSAVLIYLLFILLCILSLVATISSLALPWGYVMETIRLELEDSPFLIPSWKGNLKKFYLDGIAIQFVLFIYLLIFFMLPVVIILHAVNIICAVRNITPEQINDPAVTVLLTALAICSILFIFVIPVSIVNYSNHKTLKSAFDFITIFKTIFKGFFEFIVIYLFAFLVLILFLLIILFLTCTCVGVIFIPFVQYFVIPVILFNLFAQVYKNCNSLT